MSAWGAYGSLTQFDAFMHVAMEGSTNPRFSTQGGGYHLVKRLCAMRRVIDLEWVITMKKCSLANVLITGAAQKNFKILVCVFLILKVLINSILANIHKQIREMFVGPELSPYWNKAPCVCKSGCNTRGSREVQSSHYAHRNRLTIERWGSRGWEAPLEVT